MSRLRGPGPWVEKHQSWNSARVWLAAFRVMLLSFSKVEGKAYVNHLVLLFGRMVQWSLTVCKSRNKQTSTSKGWRAIWIGSCCTRTGTEVVLSCGADLVQSQRREWEGGDGSGQSTGQEAGKREKEKEEKKEGEKEKKR